MTVSPDSCLVVGVAFVKRQWCALHFDFATNDSRYSRKGGARLNSGEIAVHFVKLSSMRSATFAVATKVLSLFVARLCKLCVGSHKIIVVVDAALSSSNRKHGDSMPAH